jgi:hypothetical protein
MFIPYSQQKGGSHITPSDGATKKGGRVFLWLYYDLLVFSIIVALGLTAFYNLSGLDAASEAFRSTEGKFKNYLFWLKCLYGLLCAPWLVFSFPGMYTLILRLRPTAYNERGDTVRIKIRKGGKPHADKVIPQ